MNDFSSARKNLSSIMLSLQGQRRRCQDLSIRKEGSRIDYSTAPPSRVITHGTTNKLSQLKHVAPSSSGCCLKSRKHTRTYNFATHKAHFQCTPSQHMQNSKKRMQRAGRIPAFLLKVTTISAVTPSQETKCRNLRTAVLLHRAAGKGSPHVSLSWRTRFSRSNR